MEMRSLMPGLVAVLVAVAERVVVTDVVCVAFGAPQAGADPFLAGVDVLRGGGAGHCGGSPIPVTLAKRFSAVSVGA